MLGIDVSKNKLDASLADPGTRTRLWADVVTNDHAGIQKLIDRTDPSIPWVVEPTGRYSALLVKQASEAGRVVLLAPNRAAKLFLKSCNSRVKNDPMDGFGLALFGLSQNLQRFTLKSDAVEQLDQQLSARKSLADALQRLKLQRTELPHAAEALTPAIEALEKQIKVIDKAIRGQVKSDPQFALVKALQTIPGVGPVIAPAIASRLLSKGFATPEALVAYIGLDVAVRESGKSVGRVKLTKQGDAELRRLLYVAAMANLRCKQSVFKDQYSILCKRGRKPREAFNIIARKIAHVCWALNRHGGVFDATRVYRPTAASPGENRPG